MDVSLLVSQPSATVPMTTDRSLRSRAQHGLKLETSLASQVLEAFIRDEIGRARDRGLAVLWISEDLDELLLMADRIAVIFDGHIVGTLSRQEATVEQIGRMMTGMTLETAVPA